MVLLYEEVVVFLGEKALPSDEFCLSHFVEEVVVEVGPLFYEAKLGLVAVHHPSVELPLQKKGNQKPIHANESVMRALIEQQDDGHNYSKGRFEDNIHVAEESKHQLQVHILELDDFRFRDTVATLLGHPQRLRHQLPGERTLHLEGELMEQALGMLPEEDPQELYHYKFDDEIPVLSLLQVLLPHEVHELPDQLRHQQVQRCEDQRDCQGCSDLAEVGEDEV